MKLSPAYQLNTAWAIAYETGYKDEIEMFDRLFTCFDKAAKYAKEMDPTKYSGKKLFVVSLNTFEIIHTVV